MKKCKTTMPGRVTNKHGHLEEGERKKNERELNSKHNIWAQISRMLR